MDKCSIAVNNNQLTDKLISNIIQQTHVSSVNQLAGS